MKKYIILGLTLLMAFPFSAVAQDEESGQDQLETLARKLMPKQKQYPTRVTTLKVTVRSLRRTEPTN